MKNILVLDSSIMIQKIIKLAFPEEEFNLIFSGVYPVTEEIPKELTYLFVTADLPGDKDGYDVANELKAVYKCPVLIMVPKFVSFNQEKFNSYNLDGNLEKPFTSEILKDAVAKMIASKENEISPEQEEEFEVQDIDSFSDGELGNISDEEFMISDEDLEGISDEDLKDIDFDDEILNETEVEADKEIKIPEKNPEEIETAEMEAPIAEMQNVVLDSTNLDSEDFSNPIVDLNEGIEFQDEIEEGVLGDEFEADSEEIDDVSFDEEIDSEIEAMEFVEEDEIALKEEVVVELEEKDKVELPDVEFDIAEEPTTVQMDEYKITESEIEDEDNAVPFTVGNIDEYDEIDDIVAEVQEPEDEKQDFQVEEEIISEDVDKGEEFLIPPETNVEADSGVEKDFVSIGLSTDESEVEIMGAPSGLISPEDEKSVVDEILEEEKIFEEQEIVEPVGISTIMDEEEIIPAPSGIAPVNLSASTGLSDGDIKKIALEVVNLISDRILREVAWEVIPAVAEEVVKNRIQELEEEVE